MVIKLSALNFSCVQLPMDISVCVFMDRICLCLLFMSVIDSEAKMCMESCALGTSLLGQHAPSEIVML